MGAAESGRIISADASEFAPRSYKRERVDAHVQGYDQSRWLLFFTSPLDDQDVYLTHANSLLGRSVAHDDAFAGGGGDGAGRTGPRHHRSTRALDLHGANSSRAGDLGEGRPHRGGAAGGSVQAS